MNASDAKATIHRAGNELLIGVSPGGHAQVIETNHERSRAATPLELLMIALGGCTMIDVTEILRKKRQLVSDYRVEVKGERRADFPKSFSKLYVHHIITGRNLKPKAVALAIKLSDEKYCSVAATIRPNAEIITSYEIIETADLVGG